MNVDPPMEPYGPLEPVRKLGTNGGLGDHGGSFKPEDPYFFLLPLLPAADMPTSLILGSS